MRLPSGGARVEDGDADVAAHLDIGASRRQHMRDQCRRRRLAVGAGDADDLGCRRQPRALAEEQLDVADDLDAGRARPLHRPVRLGMRQRHAGSENERGEAAPVGACEIDDGNALGGAGGPGRITIIPGGNACAPRQQRTAGRSAGCAEPEDGDLGAGE